MRKSSGIRPHAQTAKLGKNLGLDKTFSAFLLKIYASTAKH